MKRGMRLAVRSLST